MRSFSTVLITFVPVTVTYSTVRMHCIGSRKLFPGPGFPGTRHASPRTFRGDTWQRFRLFTPRSGSLRASPRNENARKAGISLVLNIASTTVDYTVYNVIKVYGSTARAGAHHKRNWYCVEKIREDLRERLDPYAQESAATSAMTLTARGA